MSASILPFDSKCEPQARSARKQAEHENRRAELIAVRSEALDRVALMSREERERRARSFGFNPEGPEAA